MKEEREETTSGGRRRKRELGYLKRVVMDVYPRLFEIHHFDILGTAQTQTCSPLSPIIRFTS